MSEKREAERSDLYAVKDVAERACRCLVELQAIKSDLKPREFKRLVCKPCQATYVLGWLIEIADEG